MAHGTVEHIHIGGEKAGDLTSVQQIVALAGEGLEGDRYLGDDRGDPGRQVTLVEAEAMEGAARDSDMELAVGETRRNITTRGVALNHLVDREFAVGEARFRGIRLCEPCGTLEKYTGKRGLITALLHRGGLRAEIVQGGAISVGDAVITDDNTGP